MKSVYRVVESPIGPLTVVGSVADRRYLADSDEGTAPSSAEQTMVVIRSVCFSTSKGDEHLDPHATPAAPPGDAVRDEGDLDEAAQQIAEYFAGRRQNFDLALEPDGTEFQKRVWGELTRIPYGTAISYRELADRIGNGNAVRAVGSANGRNPIPILIPCHRVIASDGSLAGFGGGVPAKQFLLSLEGVRIPSTTDQLTIE